VTRNPLFAKDFALVNQIRRAATSIISNVAEGFEHGSNTELIQFLYIAKGSCGEVRAQLMIASDQKYIENKIYDSLYDQSRRISGMLNNLISYLKTAPHPGEKFRKPSKNKVEKEVEDLLRPYVSKDPKGD